MENRNGYAILYRNKQELEGKKDVVPGYPGSNHGR